MSTFVFVHGVYHGGWCWEKVIPYLEEKGHKVEAIDLPGSGDDLTHASEVTFESYVNKVVEVLESQSEPVILVGHSMGGLTVTQVAELRPNKIQKLVYLSALLFQNGQSFSNPNDYGLVGQYVVPYDNISLTIKDEGIKKCFYNQCSDEDINFAKARLVPQAIAPLSNPVQTTDANFGRVPRIYIECLRDNAILPSVQKEMYSTLPCEKVISMDTDHSPFFSAPQELARHLLSIAKVSMIPN
ncbi:MAG: alpha/beta fold hydrolase [Bacillota bacterium]